jgi:hypothetical protein
MRARLVWYMHNGSQPGHPFSLFHPATALASGKGAPCTRMDSDFKGRLHALARSYQQPVFENEMTLARQEGYRPGKKRPGHPVRGPGFHQRLMDIEKEDMRFFPYAGHSRNGSQPKKIPD